MLGRRRSDVGLALRRVALLAVTLIVSCGVLIAASLPMCACGPRSPSEWLAHNPNEMQSRYSITSINAAKYDAASFLASLVGQREWAETFSRDAAAIRTVMRAQAEGAKTLSRKTH